MPQTHRLPVPMLLLPSLLWALGPVSAQATDLVACVVASLPNNPNYYGMATTVTRLKCEFTRKDFYPTLSELYRQGWRLIEVVGGERISSQGSQPPSPLYYLERWGVPTPAAPEPPLPEEPAQSKKSK